MSGQGLLAIDPAFRAAVRAFLARELSDDMRAAVDHSTTLFAAPDLAREWQHRLRQAGWLASRWPREHGGAGWNHAQILTYEVEAGLAGAPLLPPFGIDYLGPALIAFGTAQQKRELLPRILSGEDYWCQGYSEPGAGSDLAALQCAAVAEGDGYRVNGTKLWTTHAHHANRIFCLVRTRREARPHQGISFLLVDLASPGITIQPIITLAGDHDVNQVFFDDVRVPRANLVGAEGQGWEIARYILDNERGGFVMSGRLRRRLRRLRQVAAVAGGIDAPAFAQQAAMLDADLLALEVAERRILGGRSDGVVPAIEASVVKLELTEIFQRLDELALDLLGPLAAAARVFPPGEANAGSPAQALRDGDLVGAYLNNRAISVFGGSNEIQRGLIARSLLEH